MRIGVLTARVPFVRGGAELVAERLRDELTRAGHDADLLAIPFASRTEEQLIDSLLSCRLWELDGLDRVIALKFPAYCVEHQDKVVWLVHQHRQAYDPVGVLGAGTRALVRRADDRHLGAARELLTISDVCAARLRRTNGLEAEVLRPPLVTHGGLAPGPYGDYVFLPGRIAEAKRQALAVHAMRFVRSNVRLVISGVSESGAYGLALRALVRRHRLGHRVLIEDRWVPEKEHAARFAGALAVLVPAEDEDFGLVVPEAFAAARPVVTCEDSGEPAAMVAAGQAGLVVAPSARALASGIDLLAGDLRLAARMGRSGAAYLGAELPDWDDVVERLTR